MALEPLNALTDLADLADPVTAVGSAVASAAMGTAATSSGLPNWATRVLVIILGLLLVAAGIFSFDKVKTTVIQAGKSAAIAA